MHDKKFWTGILENKGEIPENHSLDELSNELLSYLHSPDPQLRDEFGYQLLAHWIVGGQYETDKLNSFLDKWLSDLTTGLGDTASDTIFVRSFAALMLSVLVYYDIQQAWLSEDNYNRLVDGVLDYFLKEQDVRDYDTEKGWYHAIAHTADVLKFLARDEKSNVATLLRILDAIAEKITRPQGHIYTHGEDDRLALAVLDVVKRGLISDDAYADWLKTLVAVKDRLKPAITLDRPAYGAVQNVKHFLRALHITLANNSAEDDALHKLENQVFVQAKAF